uniref:Uncharacterized protein n=1 Tax=Moniliophthora roreri TaxID=221103 RepID=A0A0W0G6D8_MONRR
MPLCPKAAFLGDHHLSGTTILLGPQFLSPILPAPFLITSFVKLESDLESNNTSKPLSSSLSVQQDSIMCYILLDIVRYICGHDIRRPDAADKVVCFLSINALACLSAIAFSRSNAKSHPANTSNDTTTFPFRSYLRRTIPTVAVLVAITNDEGSLASRTLHITEHYDIIHYHLHGPITRTRKPRRSSAYMISPYHVLQL